MRVSQISAVPMAMATTLALLLLMYSLINTRYDVPVDNPSTAIDSIIMPETPTEIPILPPAPVKPEPPAKAPPQPAMDRVATGDPTGAPVPIPEPGPTDPISFTGIQNGNYMPIVKAAPQYPQAAASRGTEGFVVVRFTVTSNGSTRDIEVVEAVRKDGTPTSLFNSAAIAAAKQFKYQPRVQDGVPMEVHGVQNRFVFELGR